MVGKSPRDEGDGSQYGQQMNNAAGGAPGGGDIMGPHQNQLYSAMHSETGGGGNINSEQQGEMKDEGHSGGGDGRHKEEEEEEEESRGIGGRNNGEEEEEIGSRAGDANCCLCTNISSLATEEEIRKFFEFVGEISSFEYNKIGEAYHANVQFSDAKNAVIACTHLNGTWFVDRPLLIQLKGADGRIIACEKSRPAIAGDSVGGYDGVQQPYNRTATYQGSAKRAALLGQVPMVGGGGGAAPSFRSVEVQRTVYVGNLDSSIPERDIRSHFEQCGRVLFVRMAGDESQPTRYCFVEFENLDAANRAMTLAGTEFRGRYLKVNRSKTPAGKIPRMVVPASMAEVQEAMRKVRQVAQKRSSRNTSASPPPRTSRDSSSSRRRRSSSSEGSDREKESKDKSDGDEDSDSSVSRKRRRRDSRDYYSRSSSRRDRDRGRDRDRDRDRDRNRDRDRDYYYHRDRYSDRRRDDYYRSSRDRDRSDRDRYYRRREHGSRRERD
eukprot:Nk52_evm23s271 gene=Nk52_evmTU23s271